MTLRSPTADILEAAIKTFYEDDFTSMKRIESGAEAITYKACSPFYGDVCAKLFHSRAIIQGSKREIKSLLKHSFHPNIVRVLGFYEDRDNSQEQIGYVMEFMAGGSLHSAIYSDEKYKDSDVYNWIIQAGRGLQYLHEANIIHRDVKPKKLIDWENSHTSLFHMLLDKQRETLKLSDFGLAKSLDSQTNTTSGGTLPYMAPELLASTKKGEKKKKCGPASDVYALGISILEMFQRRPPYGEKVDLGLISKVAKGERPMISSSMEKVLAALLKKTWDKDPGRRCTIMDIVVFSNKKMDENKVDKSTVPASASSISPQLEVPLRVGSLNLSDGSSTSRLTTGNLSSNPLESQMWIEQNPDVGRRPHALTSLHQPAKESDEGYIPASNETFIEQGPDSIKEGYALPKSTDSGIVSSLSLADHPLPIICVLERQTKDVEFGFHLLLEKNHCHFIGVVDSGGIGDHAGLRQGQRIVGVNGTLIYPKTPHKEVVALIKKFSLTVTFLVASVEVVEWYKKHNESFSFDKAEYAHPPKQQVNQEPQDTLPSVQKNSGRQTFEEVWKKNGRDMFLKTFFLTVPSSETDHYLDTLETFVKNCKDEKAKKIPFLYNKRRWIGSSNGTKDPEELKRIAGQIDKEDLSKEGDFGVHIVYSSFAIMFYCNPGNFTEETEDTLDYMEEVVADMRLLQRIYKEEVTKSLQGIFSTLLNCLIVGDTIDAEEFHGYTSRIVNGHVSRSVKDIYPQNYTTVNGEDITTDIHFIWEAIGRVGKIHSVILLLDGAKIYEDFDGPGWRRLIPYTTVVVCHKDKGILLDKKRDELLQTKFGSYTNLVLYNSEYYRKSDLLDEKLSSVYYSAYARSLNGIIEDRRPLLF